MVSILLYTGEGPAHPRKIDHRFQTGDTNKTKADEPTCETYPSATAISTTNQTGASVHREQKMADLICRVCDWIMTTSEWTPSPVRHEGEFAIESREEGLDGDIVVEDGGVGMAG